MILSFIGEKVVLNLVVFTYKVLRTLKIMYPLLLLLRWIFGLNVVTLLKS